MTVDWTKPIEAVHEDGRVEPVQLVSQARGYEVRPILDDANGSVAVFRSDGLHPWNFKYERPKIGWRIRNVQPANAKPAEIDAAVIDRMVAFVREMAGKGRGFDSDTTLYMVASQFDEARAIVAELPEPVDPDLLEAREIEARICREAENERDAKAVEQGLFDDRPGMRGVLAAIKRGRQLEREAK